MKESIQAALDVGTSKISLTLGKLNKHNNTSPLSLDILAHSVISSIGVINGTVQNIDHLTHCILVLIKEVKRQCGIEIHEVDASVGTPLIKHDLYYTSLVKKESNSEVSEEDVKSMYKNMFRIVMLPGYKILHVIPQNFIIDKELEIDDPIGCSAAELEGSYKVISVNVKAVKQLQRGIEKAKIHLNNILHQPLSSSVSVLSEDEKKLGVCLLDIGGGTTDIVIFQNNKIKHVSSLPLGSNLITQDLKRGLLILDEEAEKIKINLGKALIEHEDSHTVLAIPPIKSGNPIMISAFNINTIIESRIVEILELAHIEILSSKVTLEAGIVLTGGGALLKDLNTLVEYVCGYHCRIGYPNDIYNFNKFNEANSPCFAAGLGLLQESLLPINYSWIKNEEINHIYNIKNSTTGKSSFFSSLNFNSLGDKLKGLLLDDLKYEF